MCFLKYNNLWSWNHKCKNLWFQNHKKFKLSELHRMSSSLILQVFGALWITYKIANWENGQRRCFRFVEILNMNFVCIQVQTFCIFSNTNALLYELKYKSYLYTLTFSNLKIEQILTKKRKVWNTIIIVFLQIQ